MVIFAAPPEGIGPVEAALCILGNNTEIPQWDWKFRIFGWAKALEFEAITAFQGPHGFTWTTWRPCEGLLEKALLWSEVKELRFDWVDRFQWRRSGDGSIPMLVRTRCRSSWAFNVKWIRFPRGCWASSST